MKAYTGRNLKWCCSLYCLSWTQWQGNPGAGYPVLAGQHASYTVIALKEYSNGNREAGINNMMQSIAPRMTEREMNAVAEYIQALGR